MTERMPTFNEIADESNRFLVGLEAEATKIADDGHEQEEVVSRYLHVLAHSKRMPNTRVSESTRRTSQAQKIALYRGGL